MVSNNPEYAKKYYETKTKTKTQVSVYCETCKCHIKQYSVSHHLKSKKHELNSLKLLLNPE
jgi:hypothetical protein